MKPTSVLLLLILSLTTYLPAANNALAGESQMNVAAIGSSDGTIKIGLPDRWNLDKKNENASFWWANFVDSRRDANIFVSMERKIGYGYRHPLLDDWGKDFAEKQIKRYAGNYSYEIRGITKKTATLGSGQIVEFSIYKLSINGNWREVVFAILSSKDDNRRVLVEIYQTATHGDMSDHIELVARGIFFSD